MKVGRSMTAHGKLTTNITNVIDADLVAVRHLFDLLNKFIQEDAFSFQLIFTKHANLREQWFQDKLVERSWTKPPTVVPEDWTQTKANDK